MFSFQSKWLRSVVLALSSAMVLAAPSRLESWPQWRGPLGTGASPHGNPPVTWSEETNIKWKVQIPGQGTSTPIIWEDKIFLLSALPTGKKIEPPPAAETPPAAEPAREPGGERRRGRGGFGSAPKPSEVHQFLVLCLDRKSGKILWQKVAREEVPHEGHHRDHGFASYSPVTDGKHLYASLGSRGLHCYDLNGNLKWQKDFGRMTTKMSFGEGSSPALHENTLVIIWDHEGDDFIAALDKNSGKELWRQARDEDTTWTTPLIVPFGGKTQVIVAATRKIRSYDLATGELLWECGGMTANVIPTPVYSDGVVYVTSGFRGNALLAIRLGKTGDLTNTDSIVWSHNKNTPYVPSPLLDKDRLYLVSGNAAILSVFDSKSGKILVDAIRLENLSGIYASPVAAGGKVYVPGRNGATAVIGPAFELLATNKLDDQIDASPAVAGNELYLRGHRYLYAIAEERKN